MDIIRQMKNSNLWFSTTDCYGILKINRPCNLACRVTATVPGTTTNSVKEEFFCITSKKSVSTFEDYVPSLDDFEVYKYTNNIWNFIVFLKIIDGSLYLCVPSNGAYELTIKQLTETPNVIEDAYIYPVAHSGSYKDAVDMRELKMSADSLGKLNIVYNGASFTSYANLIGIRTDKVIKITQTTPSYPSLIEMFGFGNASGPCDMMLNWYNGKWYARKRGYQSITLKADNSILYIATDFLLFSIFSYCGYDQFTVEVVDKPSNWDSMAVGNVVFASNSFVNSNDVTANNQLLDATVNVYSATKRVGTILSGKMYDADGYDITYNKVGTTAQRPTLTANDVGFQYFDTTLSKPIWWTGSNWVDANGLTV